MSAASREMEATTARIIIDAGGRLLARGTDGAGHRTVTYLLNGREETFHYPSSPRGNGHSTRNVYARLRRELRAIEALPPIVIAPTPIITPVAIDRPLEAVLPPAGTPPVAKKPSRRDIIKRYLSVRSYRTVAAEMGMSGEKVVQIIRASRSDAVCHLVRELDRDRAEQARRSRARRPNPLLADPKQRSKLAQLAHRLYFGKNRTAAETARALKVSVSTALKLAQEGDA